MSKFIDFLKGGGHSLYLPHWLREKSKEYNTRNRLIEKLYKEYEAQIDDRALRRGDSNTPNGQSVRTR